MSNTVPLESLDDPVVKHARTDFVAIGTQQTVQQALDSIRNSPVGGNIVYFYVVDEHGRLVGVMQTRKLLTSPLDKRVDEIMTTSVIAIPDSFTLLDACEFFVLYKLLAFPVVDQDRRILGVVDVGLFTEEMLAIEEREQAQRVFETLGVRISEVRDTSAWRGFRFRFPWLLATITSGTICAMLVGAFEVTLEQSLILAFFMTLVLGLGESVSIQAMAITVDSLHHQTPRGTRYVRMLRREIGRAFLLALACASLVGCITMLWKRDFLVGVVIASGIAVSLLLACFLGVSIPVLLHRLRLDLRVASGPITLALTDICTITAYFSLAAVILAR